MCGTFHYNINDDDKISKQLQSEADILGLIFKTGDLYPKDELLVVLPKEDKITLDVKKWGITSTKSLLINARSETLSSTYTFSKIRNNRCALPANWFYEFKDRQKYAISKMNCPTFFLAGIFNGQNEFVLLTGKSENEMAMIHERSPIILNTPNMLRYLHGQLTPVVDNRDLVISRQKDSFES